MSKFLTRRDFLKVSGLTAAGASAAALLAGCKSDAGTTTGGSTGTAGSEGGAVNANALTDYITYATSEGTTWNPLYSQAAVVLDIAVNYWEGLVTNDRHGGLAPSLAETWNTPDGKGKTWTFNLRKGVKWVDQNGEEKAEVTAHDFVTALEWILNFWKNDGNNCSFPHEMIEGAKAYTDYTKEMEPADAQGITDYAKFCEMVGIKAEDDYTLTYTCVSELPYFPTLATYIALYPVCADLVNTLGWEAYTAITPEQQWYCGAYIVTEYVSGNSIVVTPNPKFWDAENVTRFESATTKIVESHDTAFNLYQTNEIDRVRLTESNMVVISSSPSHQYADYLTAEHGVTYNYNIYWNWHKNTKDDVEDTDWNQAVANRNFRKSIYHGMDLTNYLSRQNYLYPMQASTYGILPEGLGTIGGKDYTDVVRDKMGYSRDVEVYPRYDAALAKEYKEKALAELKGKVNFPVEMRFYVQASNQTALDTAKVLQQVIHQGLGEDYINFVIDTYVSSFSNEVDTFRYNSFRITGWSADYGDPMAIIGLCVSDNKEAGRFIFKNGHFDEATDEGLKADLAANTELIRKAEKIVDNMEDRLAAFAEAEYDLVHEKCLVTPLYRAYFTQLTKVNDYSKPYACYGMQGFRMINWETNADGYTTAEYEQFAADYAAGK